MIVLLVHEVLFNSIPSFHLWNKVKLMRVFIVSASLSFVIKIVFRLYATDTTNYSGEALDLVIFVIADTLCSDNKLFYFIFFQHSYHS